MLSGQYGAKALALPSAAYFGVRILPGAKNVNAESSPAKGGSHKDVQTRASHRIYHACLESSIVCNSVLIQLVSPQ